MSRRPLAPVVLALPLLLAALGGCKNLTQFAGPQEFQDWDKRALANPTANPSYRQFADTYNGKPEALHRYFLASYTLASSMAINVEASESMAYSFETFVRKLGDVRFSTCLAKEKPEIRSAVAVFVSQPAFAAYPKTLALLKSAPRIDFPILRVSRGIGVSDMPIQPIQPNQLIQPEAAPQQPAVQPFQPSLPFPPADRTAL